MVRLLRTATPTIGRMMSRGNTARQESLALPGWAWERGRSNLWVLGVRTVPDGYTLEAIARHYARAKRQAQHGSRLDRWYVRVHPSMARQLVLRTDIALTMDPTAMHSDDSLRAVQFHVRIGRDRVQIQISHNFDPSGQNCIFHLFAGNDGRPGSQVYPLPRA